MILGDLHVVFVSKEGWFCIESDISGPIDGRYYYDVAALCQTILSSTAPTVENHLNTWMREPDWEWLVEHGINTIRVNVRARFTPILGFTSNRR